MKPAGLVSYVFVTTVLCSTLYAAERLPTLTSAMDEDPQLTSSVQQYYLPPGWTNLWREALTSPEQDLRREAAVSVMRLHQHSNLDLTEMKQPMLDGFRSATNPTVRLTLASALIQLEVRAAADDLFELVKSGHSSVSRWIEPTLSQWQFKPIRKLWLERIQNPSMVTVTHLVLAAEGLADAKEFSAVPGLHQLATDQSAAIEIRLAAATAVGSMTETGMTDTSRQLASDLSDGGLVNRMIAVRLLAGHEDESTEELLLSLAQDDRPVVSAIALQRLLEFKPQSILSIADCLLIHSNMEVRRLTAQSLVNRPSPTAVQQLADLLQDPHPAVRGYVRESLYVLAQQDDLADAVQKQCARILASDDWKGLEQAVQLAGSLDLESAAGRLVELLKHERMEVGVTAAWSLRELAVMETLPAIHQFVMEITDPFPANVLQSTGAKLTEREDACLACLFEAMGQARFSVSAPILLRFVPNRSDLGLRSRTAAVWALGFFYRNDPPKQVVRQLTGRIAACAASPPSEAVDVGTAAAISLGRMKATSALEPLRDGVKNLSVGGRVYQACQWAIAQITGTEQPVSPPRPVPPQNPFLRSTGL